jgi:hypothetical protein
MRSYVSYTGHQHPSKWREPILATTVEIVLRQTNGEKCHDKLHIDRSGRSFTAYRNAGNGKAAH